MKDPQQELTVKFVVTGIPDSAGLRIRATEPTGLYISSADPEAAKWYFEIMIVELIGMRKLLTPKRGGGLRSAHKINWDEALLSGSGEVAIRTVSRRDMEETMRLGTPVLIPPVKELTVDWWTNRAGNYFCMIRDPGEQMDGWLFEAVTEQLETKGSA